ncbi:hypothetical protein AK812_SmicGene8346 [Symbiodinium microadriaticum]|uniref:C2H2-type domain-containing protein n=1 Tax=Symbiodinium microadriaticum TaxID=2951 RepID=A0A1Q9EL94_SYMMI|nr:hypothetical protein AK812_SmicGene8346 [Symbiodinium microadriaticum]
MVGAGSWPELSGQEWAAFSGGVIGLYRQLLGLRAEGDWHLTEAQLVSRAGLPPPRALLQAERLRLLGQLTRCAPDSVWALLGWYEPFQSAVRLAGDWFLSLVGCTCELGAIDTDWSSWSSLFLHAPGRFKGMLRRAEACDLERCHILAGVDSLGRSVWQPQGKAVASNLQVMDQACLICGLAFPSRQQWGAHAQRVHGYRNRASRVCKGRRCQACGSQYASAARLQKHLLFSARCAQYLERLDDADPRLTDTSSCHPQAPFVRGWGVENLESAEDELCRALLLDLQTLQAASDQEIYDLVLAHLAPLPVLRATLLHWIAGLASGALRDAAEDVVLILHPEHLCSAVVGQVRQEVRDEIAFRPSISPPFFLPAPADLPVFFFGCIDLDWIARWTLEDRRHVCCDLTSLPNGPLKCGGLFLDFSPPPFSDACLLQPSAKPLRALREHRVWILALLHAVRCALHTGYDGLQRG